jgi:hypothetical protein
MKLVSDLSMSNMSCLKTLKAYHTKSKLRAKVRSVVAARKMEKLLSGVKVAVAAAEAESTAAVEEETKRAEAAEAALPAAAKLAVEASILRAAEAAAASRNSSA